MATQEEIREHVTRLLDSEQFVSSRSIARLLTFCVDAVLAGDEETLKETTIGVSCFGRSPGYDTKLDPIVRVTARRLRSKLDIFYENEGANNEVRIVLLKGTYVPRFHSRSNPTSVTEPSLGVELVAPDVLPTAEPLSVLSVPLEVPSPLLVRSSWLRPAFWSLLVLLGVTSGALLLTHTRWHQETNTVRSQDSTSHVSPTAEDDVLATVEPRL